MKPYTLSTSGWIVHASRLPFRCERIRMTEVWLHPNRRALWIGCVPPLLFGGLGAWIALDNTNLAWQRGMGIGLATLAAILMMLLLQQLRRPRVAFREGEVLFYLRANQPIAVPVHIIEAFFIGQGPAYLPAKLPQHEKSLNLVARLSRRAPDWSERDVKPALGHWSDGYVTIRGTWCEPLNVEVVRRLNRRLKEVQNASGVAYDVERDQRRSGCENEPC